MDLTLDQLSTALKTSDGLAPIGQEPTPATEPTSFASTPKPARRAQEKQQKAIYGSFMIGETEFAIPVSSVQEVVNEPKDISPVPLSPDYMLGLFNLREKIVPVVDLRKLLEYPEAPKDKAGKVAIIEHGAHSIGLLFDRTSEVLNGKDAARVDFKPNDRGIKDIVIEGVLKFEGGDRLVQILDPQELLNLEKLPRSNSSAEASRQAFSRGKRHSCISFQTGHTSCAIDLRFVKEVRELPKLDQSLFAHGHILGTANLRGVILPVIDFRSFLGDEPVIEFTQPPQERRMLVIETPEGPVGLMVYSIDSILPYYEDEILPFAKLALPCGDLVEGCLIDQENRIVMMIKPEMLQEDKGFMEAAKACQEIYPPEADSSETSTDLRGTTRRTFIQFTFDKRFALETSKVSEVIERPAELLEPPFALKFVEGIINLRGDLITLLNPRLLYGMPPTKTADQKVLIFKHKGQRFGILVDSVDEIIMTTENQIAALKPIDKQNTERSVAEDVAGCIQHTNTFGTLNSVLILDTDALVTRCLRSMEQ
ncbi:chemotaxis protein CheW [Shimia sp. R9_3]|uniref:chemotaxis protein CheW n=1 Tax=Shimia sp. R9_3 TaxID=2821113 RepID=UPI001ADD6094|nr:chemotaxis protein CheW [Shimia sp. R9_3]MBO9402863.1 chemotaxis protein CheW [Shimia sp. R9_3]